jgi:hypothetical protein
MRRANGDWFSLDDHGRFRVPVFRSSWDGMMARAGNWGMQLFKPVALDGPSLGDLLPTGGGEVYFWMVDNPFTQLSRGHSIDHEQLALLVHNSGQLARG